MFGNEIEIIRLIQSIRNEYFDIFFKILNFFDSHTFFYLLLPIMWVGYNKKFGLKLTCILLLSSLVNEFLKITFQLPRPFHIDPTLFVIAVKGFSFPSGGAQSAVLLPLVFIDQFKGNKWPKIIGILFFILISLSRMYLGLHYLSDVLAGWIVGFLIFLIYKFGFSYLEKILGNKPIWFFWIYQILILPFLFIPKTSTYGFAFLGLIFGVLLSNITFTNLSNPKNFKEFFVRSIFVISGILLLFFFYKLMDKRFMFFDFSTLAYLVGLWISFICPFCYLKVFSKKKLRG